MIYKDLVIFSRAFGYRHAAAVGSDSNYWVIQLGSPYTITEQARSDMIYGIQRDDLFATSTQPGAQDNDLLGPTFLAGSAEDPTNKQWA